MRSPPISEKSAKSEKSTKSAKSEKSAKSAKSAKSVKVGVCHVDDGGLFNLITVSQNALPAHLGHGDGQPGGAVPSGGQVFGSACELLTDTDGDLDPDETDLDDDNDGVNDDDDAFPLDATETADNDGDLVGDNSDNCLDVANTNQADADENGVGDACEVPSGLITYYFTAAGGHSGSFTYDNTAATNGFLPFGQGGPSYPGLSFVLDGVPQPNPVIQIFDNYQGQYDIVYFTTLARGPSVELWGAAGSAVLSGSGLDQLDNITLQDFIPAFRAIGNTLFLGTYPSGGVQLTSFGQ